MNRLFELLGKMLIDGIIDMLKNNQISGWIKIPLGSLFLVFYAFASLLFVALGVENLMHSNHALGIILILLGFLLAFTLYDSFKRQSLRETIVLRNMESNDKTVVLHLLKNHYDQKRVMALLKKDDLQSMVAIKGDEIVGVIMMFKKERSCVISLFYALNQKFKEMMWHLIQTKEDVDVYSVRIQEEEKDWYCTQGFSKLNEQETNVMLFVKRPLSHLIKGGSLSFYGYFPCSLLSNKFQITQAFWLQQDIQFYFACGASLLIKNAEGIIDTKQRFVVKKADKMIFYYIEKEENESMVHPLIIEKESDHRMCLCLDGNQYSEYSNALEAFIIKERSECE